jgi:hypothetical protein
MKNSSKRPDRDTRADQRLLDAAGQADVYEATRQGMADIIHGRTRPAREVFDELRGRHGILPSSAEKKKSPRTK